MYQIDVTDVTNCVLESGRPVRVTSRAHISAFMLQHQVEQPVGVISRDTGYVPVDYL